MLFIVLCDKQNVPYNLERTHTFPLHGFEAEDGKTLTIHIPNNTVMEAYNITNKKASDQLQKKFMHEGKHSKRSAANNEMDVPENPPKTLYRFFIYWSKTLGYDTKGHNRGEYNR